MPHRQFGIWTLSFLVIANMVGAGVFTTSGFTLAAVGSPALVVAAWAIGGGIAVAGALSYGQLVRRMPESGGEYLFLSRAAHPFLGYLAGWVSLIAGFTGAIAFAATALTGYLPLDHVPDEIHLFGTQSLPKYLPGKYHEMFVLRTDKIIALAVIVLAAGLHGIRPLVGAAFQNVAVVLKLSLIAGLLVAALFCLPPGFSNNGQTLPPPDHPMLAFGTSLIWISLSYLGFNAAVYVAEEARSPDRDVPRALWLGTTVVTLFYVALNTLFVFVPPPEAIAGQPDVAAIVAEQLGGTPAAQGVRIVIAIALFTSVTSMMMAAPRVYAKMAADGLLPARLRSEGASPRQPIVLQVVLAAVLILVSSLQGLLTYLGLTLSLSAACSVACLFLPSIRRGGWLQWQHLPPLFYVTATLLTATLMTIDSPQHLLGTTLTFVAGGVAYIVTRFRSRSSPRHESD